MRSSHQPAPSLPPSPVEEDISRASPFLDEVHAVDANGHPPQEAAASSKRESSRSRGKERAGQGYAGEGDEDEAWEETQLGYPPTKESESESRRVHENLRRWEMAERQRRKAARESANSSATAPTTSTAAAAPSASLVGGVARTASLLWRSRRSRQASLGGVGTHVPLEDIDAPPEPENENPFTTPAASTVSLVLNDPHHSAVMSESPTTSDLPPTPFTAANERSHLVLPGSGSERTSPPQPPPPPQPLGLPAPRTPPPRTGTPHANRPPEPIPPPVAARVEEEEPVGETRWWTEWLCGCSERGDHQAGRTNPFE